MAVLGYLGLAVVLTWPLALHLGTSVPGLANVDLFDTAWLHMAVARDLLGGSWPWSQQLFFPTGYPVGEVVPNYVDHLSAAPLVLALPWPLADNLWWLLVLTANGLAGHLLGRHLGGSHAHGALVGVLLAASEPVLREANLGHAPQALVCWAPLALWALLRTLEEQGRWLHAGLAGAFLALAALTYWYLGLFVALAGLPITTVALWQAPERRALLARLGLLSGVTLLLSLGPLLASLAVLGGSVPAAQMPDLQLTQAVAAVPEAQRWTLAHGGDALWPFRAQPLDRSNRLPLVLLAAVILGWRRSEHRWPWLVAAVLAGLLLMGPYLKLGEQPLLLAGHPIPLPGRLAAELPVLSRLTWPQRWGIVVVLALLPLAARAPRPGWLAGLALVEILLLSGNAPLHNTRVAHFQGWRALADTPGAVLSLPLERNGPYGPLIAGAYRTAEVPLASGTAMPPWAKGPHEWDQWRADSPFLRWLAVSEKGQLAPLPPQALDQLRQEGFGAIAVDLTPGTISRPSQRQQTLRVLEQGLGEGADYGSVVVWWLYDLPEAPEPLDNPDLWRALQRKELQEQADPQGRTVFRPLRWNVDR